MSTRTGRRRDDHGHFDPHYWMDPENMEQMVYNIRDGLLPGGPGARGEYEENAAEQAGLLHTWDDALQDMIREAGGERRGGDQRPDHLPRRIPLFC